MRAARTGSYKSTILLVDAGANLRAKDVNGNTAVDLASGRTVQFFKAYDNRTEAGENWFYTQMRIGDYNALSAIFQIHKSQDSLEPLVHQYDSERRTPLDIALASGNETAIRFLLNNGADPRKGKFNGLRWAREIPEWSSSSGTTPSIYEAIYLTYAIYHFQESQLFSELPKEVQAHIAHFLFILMVPVIEH
jgi:ankyrin repeat protein